MTEQFYNLKEASGLLNIPYFKLQRAAKRGLIPTHQLYNSKRMVRLSEIEQAMRSNKTGEEGGEE